MDIDPSAARLSTRLAFFANGFCMACWAPLVPFVKARLGVDDGTLGMLLLCLGFGSVIAMPITGTLAARLGAKPLIVAGGIGMLVVLPALSVVNHSWELALALLCFGASLGTTDVAMNMHAVEVERMAGKPLMSGFHALFSLGGFAGSGGMTALLSIGMPTTCSALGASVLVAVTIGIASPRFLKSRPASASPIFVVPHRIVLLLAFLASALFLTEGAMLDWGALLITKAGLVARAQSGIGYMIFSIAMTVGRLTGDRIVARLGGRRVLQLGGLTMSLGIVLLVLAPVAAIAMPGFFLIGIGASNLVPIIFSQAGGQKAMPPGLAIAAVTTMGYAGILVGPAAIGFVARSLSLPAAFWILAGLVMFVPLLARRAVAEGSQIGLEGAFEMISPDAAAVRAHSLIDNH
jgi:MFS family permease